ncbi:MAG: hypothetical protein QNJ57_10160 [Flavobacteriaceae bacterium]|nr:hypothetical protein [Flavobacteriaceae bacterium]
MKTLTAIILLLLSSAILAQTDDGDPGVSTEVVDDGILYKTSQDQNNVHIIISTSDKGKAMIILRLGLTVYFDVTGKSKRRVFVKYPDKLPPPSFDLDQKERSLDPDFNILIEQLPLEAIYGYFGDQQPFNIQLNDHNISLRYSYSTDEVFSYELHIPKSKLTDKTNEDFSKLTIGVVSGAFKSKMKTAGISMSPGARTMRSRSGSGMSPGGITSGGMAPGGTRGMAGNRGNRPRGGQSMPSIDFWFDANLTK